MLCGAKYQNSTTAEKIVTKSMQNRQHLFHRVTP